MELFQVYLHLVNLTLRQQLLLAALRLSRGAAAPPGATAPKGSPLGEDRVMAKAQRRISMLAHTCLLYTSDAADE